MMSFVMNPLKFCIAFFNFVENIEMASACPVSAAVRPV